MTAPRRAGYGEARDFVASVIGGTAPVEPNGCVLWPFAKNGKGYAMVGGHAWGSRSRPLLVGRIVLEHTQGPRPTPQHTMGHAPAAECGNRHCVAPAHLSWQTPAEQSENQRRDGTLHPPRVSLGAAHHFAKHSDDEVAAAVARVRNGEPRVRVADDLGVNVSTLRRWTSGKFRRQAAANV